MDKNTVQDPESKPSFFRKINPKTGFYFGLMVGITAVSLIGFLSLLGVVLNKGNVAGSGKVAGEVKTNQPNKNVNTNPSQAQQPKAPAQDIVITDDDHSIGPKDAKVTLVEYSDFQCPYCGKHYSTMKNLQEKYKDRVRFVFRHFPLDSIHPNARPAANASECASEQGKFWEIHDKLFENQNSLGNDLYSKLAKEMGLDTGKFEDCVKSNKYEQIVIRDQSSGLASGVEGTPATFVITADKQTMISGAVPQPQVETAIDQALGK